MGDFFASLMAARMLFIYNPHDSYWKGSLTICVGSVENSEDYSEIKRKIYKWSIETQPSVMMLKEKDGTPAFPIASLHHMNTLIYNRLSYSDMMNIISGFPDTIHLTFISVGTNGFEFQYLAQMLMNYDWSQHLISLKVVNCSQVQYLGFLFRAINDLISLQTLWLDMGIAHMDELSILDQLSEMRLHCLDAEFPVFIRSLEKYVPESNPNDLRVDLSNVQLSLFLQLEERLSFNNHHHVRRLFNRLSNRQLYSSSMDVSAFCANYTMLTSVTFAFPSAELERIFLAFESLKHLHHLRLTINFGDRAMHGSHRLESPFSPGERPFSAIPDPVPMETQRLKSVKALDLEVIFPTHAEVRWLNLAVTMPNLQSLAFVKYTCRECKEFEVYSYREPVLNCNREISIRCFRRFLDDLHTGDLLYYTTEDVLVPARKLLDKNGDISKVEVVNIENPHD